MTMRPEATPLDFVIRPQSKIDPDEVRARSKQVSQDQRRVKVKLLLPLYRQKPFLALFFPLKSRSWFC